MLRNIVYSPMPPLLLVANFYSYFLSRFFFFFFPYKIFDQNPQRIIKLSVSNSFRLRFTFIMLIVYLHSTSPPTPFILIFFVPNSFIGNSALYFEPVTSDLLSRDITIDWKHLGTNFTFRGDLASKWMRILCTDPSCQNRFILTVHLISCGEAVLLDQ